MLNRISEKFINEISMMKWLEGVVFVQPILGEEGRYKDTAPVICPKSGI